VRTWHEGDMITLKGEFKNSDDNAIIDLTGANVSLIFWFNNGVSTLVDATTTNPTAGLAEYQFTSGLQQPGFLQWLWRVVDVSSFTFFSEKTFKKSVRRVP